MKFIFWTNSYDGGVDYLERNLSLQDVSRKHEFFFMNSGEKSEKAIGQFYDGQNINCENDKAIKGKVLFDHLKGRDDYDALVRIDLDAIIFDLDKLLKKIEGKIKGKHAVMGNTKKFKGRRKGNKKYRGIKYVRGGCNCASRSVVDRIDMITEEKAGFDIPYAMSFHKTGCKMISCKLFEINKKYIGKCPVWHPVGKGEPKMNNFLREIKKYERT